MIIKDEGYYFGLGAFETIAVENGIPCFLEQHYQRLFRALEFLQVHQSPDNIRKQVDWALADQRLQSGRKVLKITVSEKNVDVSIRTNPYTKEDYRKGFLVSFSKVRRNETSPLTYHKTLNYGDCILEKRHALEKGFHEAVFLNTKGELAEGTTTNLFLIKERKIVTPSLACGILPGIIREYLLQTLHVEEKIIFPHDIMQYDEMFLTNSLLGIMPVKKIGNYTFKSMDQGTYLARNFCECCKRY